MKCSFSYCLYQEKGQCTVREIQINEFGMCDDCMVVALEDNLVAVEKRKQREAINKRWAACEMQKKPPCPMG